MRRAVTAVRAATAVVVGVAALLVAGPAGAAQQCHPLAGSVWRNPGMMVGVRLDAAGYRNQSYEGDYQGLAPTLGFNHPRVAEELGEVTPHGRRGRGVGCAEIDEHDRSAFGARMVVREFGVKVHVVMVATAMSS